VLARAQRVHRAVAADIVHPPLPPPSVTSAFQRAEDLRAVILAVAARPPNHVPPQIGRVVLLIKKPCQYNRPYGNKNNTEINKLT